MNKHYKTDLSGFEISKECIFSDFQTARKFTGLCPADLSDVEKIAKKNRFPESLSARLVNINKEYLQNKNSGTTINYSNLLTSETIENLPEDTDMEDMNEKVGNLASFLQDPDLCLDLENADPLVDEDEVATAGTSQQPGPSQQSGPSPTGPGVLYSFGARMQQHSEHVRRMTPVFILGDKDQSVPYDQINIVLDYVKGKIDLYELPVTFMDFPPDKWFQIVQEGAPSYIQYMTTGYIPSGFELKKYEYAFLVYKAMMLAVGRYYEAVAKKAEESLSVADDNNEWGALAKKIETFLDQYKDIEINGDSAADLSNEELIWSYLTGISAARKSAMKSHKCVDTNNELLTKMGVLEGRVAALTNNYRKETGILTEQHRAVNSIIAMITKDQATIHSDLQDMRTVLNQLTVQITNLSKFVSSVNFRQQTPEPIGDYKIPTAAPEITLQERLKQYIAKMVGEYANVPIQQAAYIIGINSKVLNEIKTMMDKDGFPYSWHNVLACSGYFGRWPMAHQDKLEGFSTWYATVPKEGNQLRFIIEAIGNLSGDVTSQKPQDAYHTPSGTRLTQSSW